MRKESRGATIAILLLTVAFPAHAQTLAVTPRGDIVVAHDGRLDVYRTDLHKPAATYEGVRFAGAVAAGDDRVALLDPLANTVVTVDLATGRRTSTQAGETPVGALFAGRDLFVVCRDGRTVERITPDGRRGSIPTGADPELLRLNGTHLYVYSRVDGLLQELTTNPFAVMRQAQIAPFASDMEVDDSAAYLAYPAEGMIRTISLAALKSEGQTRIGAVPTDIALGGGGTALTARNVIVADPSSKRVWVVEGKQSVWEAFARGFLRGFVGLGFFGSRDSAFPSGVDRVIANGSGWVAYDTSSGSLYRFSKTHSDPIASGIAPNAFALDSHRVIYWQNGTLVAEKLAR